MSADTSNAENQEQYGYLQVWTIENAIGILSFSQGGVRIKFYFVLFLS